VGETELDFAFRRGHGWPDIFNGCKPFKMPGSEGRGGLLKRVAL
jgi:hypothetical protein